MKKVCPFVVLFMVCLFSGIVTPQGAYSSGGESFAFPEIAGWRQSGEIQTFAPKNLYDYINGGADLYLKYDFQELKVAEYQGDQKAAVTVEIYRHKTPNHAFGIYSQERLSGAHYLNIGTQAYNEKGILNFLKGSYYVKINGLDIGPEEDKVLIAFAKKVAGNLEGGKSLPSILSSFPQEGKKDNSEKFIVQNFLGYSYLHSAFTTDYDLAGKKFKLFVIEGAEQKDCRNMLRTYLQRTGSSQIKLAEGRFTLKDPYHGEMDFFWKGRYIWGALDLDDSVLRSKYLKLFEEGLQKKK